MTTCISCKCISASRDRFRTLSNLPLVMCDITGEKKSNGRRQPSDLSLNLIASAVTPNPATGEGASAGMCSGGSASRVVTSAGSRFAGEDWSKMETTLGTEQSPGLSWEQTSTVASTDHGRHALPGNSPSIAGSICCPSCCLLLEDLSFLTSSPHYAS